MSIRLTFTWKNLRKARAVPFGIAHYLEPETSLIFHADAPDVENSLYSAWDFLGEQSFEPFGYFTVIPEIGAEKFFPGFPKVLTSYPDRVDPKTIRRYCRKLARSGLLRRHTIGFMKELLNWLSEYLLKLQVSLVRASFLRERKLTFIENDWDFPLRRLEGPEHALSIMKALDGISVWVTGPYKRPSLWEHYFRNRSELREEFWREFLPRPVLHIRCFQCGATFHFESSKNFRAVVEEYLKHLIEKHCQKEELRCLLEYGEEVLVYATARAIARELLQLLGLRRKRLADRGCWCSPWEF
ncbi:hypothetical protein [Candidatus Caldatribacterium saccharofermentans]|uniref:hypothetical protein n=1 Tax=Candidatus Caldatribacterium saccharofermentans TaxID=1454753 RepID=UPI00035F0761